MTNLRFHNLSTPRRHPQSHQQTRQKTRRERGSLGAKEKGVRMVGQVDIDSTFKNIFYINIYRERGVCIYV